MAGRKKKTVEEDPRQQKLQELLVQARETLSVAKDFAMENHLNMEFLGVKIEYDGHESEITELDANYEVARDEWDSSGCSW